ncbi:hypothetical protein BC941DRAFT_505369 [Chlamydoabsidia padenii]|nr:hypothetical protein BC941DRAFT_505369 [Chlamydoabsidia padenii]
MQLRNKTNSPQTTKSITTPQSSSVPEIQRKRPLANLNNNRSENKRQRRNNSDNNNNNKPPLMQSLQKRRSRGIPIAIPTVDKDLPKNYAKHKRQRQSNVKATPSPSPITPAAVNRNTYAIKGKANKSSKRETQPKKKVANDSDCAVNKRGLKRKQNTTPDLPNNNSTTKKYKSKSDTSKKQPTDILVIPKKHIIRQHQHLLPPTSLPELETPKALAEGHVSCPYCQSDLNLKNSRTVLKAYKEIERKNLAYLKQQASKSRGNKNKSVSMNCPLQRPVSHLERDAFCELHRTELVVRPEGDKCGWPSVIRFDKIKGRILGFKTELDQVISNTLASTYRDMALEAYKSLGKNRARSSAALIHRFEKVLPGYYGPKGSSVIQTHLAEMYLHPGIINKTSAAPQTPLEYLQQVLVPEVGYRLIREDLIKKCATWKKNPDIDNHAKQDRLGRLFV